MFKKWLLVLALLSLLLIPLARAQEDGNPTIAILRFGSLAGSDLTLIGILDTLEIYDFINAEEQAALGGYQDLEGEKINVIWRDANFDFPTVNLMISDAIDRGADALLTLSTPVTQAAVNATLDMDDPPVVLFTTVYNPYQSGIADAPCIKPDHVTGTETLTPYEDIVPLLLLQDPDMKKIGTIYSSSETSGVLGAERIKEIGESLGLTVETAAVTSLPDLSLAAEGLISKGVEAFLIPTDLITTKGLPLLMALAIENSIPIFHSSQGGIYAGATISAGSGLYYALGVNVGYILTAHLNEAIDIATTGISAVSNMGVSVNMDLAMMQNAAIPQTLMEKADYVIQNRELRVTSLEWLEENIAISDSLQVMIDYVEQQRNSLQAGQSGLPQISPEILSFAEGMESFDYKAGGEAFLKTLACTPERIAEQQAELDAQGG